VATCFTQILARERDENVATLRLETPIADKLLTIVMQSVNTRSELSEGGGLASPNGF
jgi:hypothetical protein